MSKEQQNHEPASETRSNDAAMIEAALREVKTAARPGDSPGSDAVGFTAPPPDSFVGYDVIDEVHRGGQGVVFRAIQKATRREVAIKVLREGPFTGHAEKARFDREVQVLGQLSHPNIVTVHDTGVAAGSHYFVMDYVSGQPLDVSLARGDWSIDETLRLFAKICAAVNAAHLRGVIHRDLKPSNILIDEDGEPQILDFGLAKVATSDSDVSAMTITGQFVGSLPWASPEQAEAVPSKIDVRTDVYSLGVILYHMLTGKFPYNVIGNVRDVIDNILTAEPARPSTIRKQINDEVETIALKCLHKERERRYQTAGELARDVRHYLNGEPIEAKRDSAAYVLRKQLKRYKLPLTIAAAFVLVITVGFAASLTFWRQAEHKGALAEENAQQAESEAGKATATSEFLRDMFGSIDPDVARGREITVREMLDKAAEKIDRAFPDQPEVESTLRRTIGQAYFKLGKADAADTHLSLALDTMRGTLGENHPETLKVFNDLVGVRAMQGKLGEAEEMARQALEAQQQVLPEDHPCVLSTMNNLTVILQQRGKLAEAETLIRRVVEIYTRDRGEHDVETLHSTFRLACVLSIQGKLAEAKSCCGQALTTARDTLGEDHTVSMLLMTVLAIIHLQLEEFDEAEALLVETLPIQRRVLGDQHMDTLATMANLATMYSDRGRYELAEPLLAEVLATHRTVLGNEHVQTLIVMDNLGKAYIELDRPGAAEPLLKEASDTFGRVLPEGHWRAGSALASYGQCLCRLQRYSEAEEKLLEAYRILATASGARQEDSVEAVEALVELYEAWDAAEPGQGYAEKAAECRAKLPTTQPVPADEQPTSGEE